MKILKIDPKICEKFQIKLIYLFGSQAKGKSCDESDFDLAVFFKERNDTFDFFNETIYLKEALREYFPNEVDIVALNRSTSLLKYEVISTGILLYADDQKFRLDFEVLSLKEYIDDQYVRDIYHLALTKRIEEGVF